MVLKNRRTLSTTASYSASTTSSISLPRDFLIQRINLSMVGTPVITSSVSTLVSGSPWALCKYIRVKAVGEGSSKTIYEVKGEDIGNLNYFQYGTAVKMQNSPVAIATHTNLGTFNCTLDFRVDTRDVDDFSTSIPSYLLSTLTLEIDWDTVALGYGSNTAFTGTVSVSLVEGIPEPNDPDFSNNPLQTTLYKELTGDTSSASVEDFSTFFNVGALIRTNYLISETSSGVLSDGELEYYTVTSGTIPLISKQNFRDSKQQDIEDWGLAASGNTCIIDAGLTGGQVAGGTALYMSPLMNQPAISATSGLQTVTGWTAIDFMNPLNPFISTEAGSEIDGMDTSSFNVGDLTLSVYKNNASSILRTIQISVEG